MRLRNLMMAALTLLAVNASAQMMPAIPVDKDVRIGKLDNGLTYYIRHNNYPEHMANFYIAQKVGSVNEDDNQRGLAHLLEHMAFNGSDHFKDNSMQEYLQSIGVEYGRNLNAYTSTDQTVYYITDVPTKRISALDSCMLVLKDWSNGLTLDEKAIDAERDVVHNEYRMRITGTQKILETVLPDLYPGSKYGQRFPIGLMEIIDGCSPETLRAYYRKWYRPDNQGIIIVGDIDVDRTEAKIKELFGATKVPADAAKVLPEAVPDNDEGIFIVGKDKEQTLSLILAAMKRDAIPDQEKGNLDYLMAGHMEGLMADMLNTRYQEEAQKADCPYVQASVENGSYLVSRTKDALTLSVVPKDGQELEALTAAIRELKRARDFGFTATEYDRARDERMSQLEKRYNNREKLPSNDFCQAYVSNFIANEPIPGIEDLYQLMSQVSPMIPVDAINMLTKELIEESDTNLVVLALMQDKEGKTYPTREELKQSVDKVWSETLTAYVDNVKQEPLMTTLPKAGKIIKETRNDVLGFTQLTLSNGATVLMKKTDFNADEILVRASAKGGMGLFGDKDVWNVQIASELLTRSGLGNFSNTELQKALSGKQCGVDFTMSENRHGITGHTTPKELETLMQLLHLSFTNVKKDEQAATNFTNMLELSLKNISLNASAVFQDSVQSNLYSGNLLYRIPTVEGIKSISYDRILEMAKQMYGNASDFVFTIVGNYDEAQLRQLIEQYIASLPAKKQQKVNVKDVRTYAKGEKQCHFTKQMENPQAQACEIWRSDAVAYNLENIVKMDIATRMLDMLYNREIREKLSAAYHAGAQGNIDHNGDCTYMVLSGVGMLNPDKVGEAVPCFLKGLQQTIDDPNSEDLSKVKEILLKKADEDAMVNAHWSSVLATYIINGIDIETPYKQTVQGVTANDIRTFLKDVILKGNNHIELIMMPQQ